MQTAQTELMEVHQDLKEEKHALLVELMDTANVLVHKWTVMESGHAHWTDGWMT